MSTTTTNYGFTLPAVADPIDQDLWGTELNTNFSTLDTLLGALTANKQGALVVQNSTDNGFSTITSQGTSGYVLTSNGSDANPSWQTAATAALLGAIYPIGSIYCNISDSTNPATLFGFGTWVAITNSFLIGASGTYAAGSTGGATTHTLTTSEIPALTYSLSSFGSSGGSSGNYLAQTSYSNSTNQGPTGASTITTNAGGGSHSILNPYTSVYIWKRTA